MYDDEEKEEEEVSDMPEMEDWDGDGEISPDDGEPSGHDYDLEDENPEKDG